MNWLKKGPELKVPDLKALKAPQFLVDLYWDLRDRHLLPIVGLALIGIVAVPFLLGGSKSEAPPPVAPVATAPSPEATTSSSKLTVVESQPGLRVYKKRLAHRQPTNPFKQRFTSPVLSGTKLGGGGGGGGSSGSTSTTTTVTTGGSGSGGEGGSGSAPRLRRRRRPSPAARRRTRAN